MEIAIWDTYYRKPDGTTLHFDIAVPAAVTDAETVYAFGREYLKQKGFPDARLHAERCRFCHIETATSEMKEAIGCQGYFIVELEEIPPELPPHPARRDYILHLRAHYPQYRFADFRDKSLEEVRQLLWQEWGRTD